MGPRRVLLGRLRGRRRPVDHARCDATTARRLQAAEHALAYAGSLGPLSIPGTVRCQFLAIGQTLAGSFALAGLFGVDAVVDGGTVYPVEVNPRYTASTEVLGCRLRIHAVQFHVNFCRHGQRPRGEFASNRVCGKAIVYARADITVPAEFVDFATKQIERTDWPDLADFPAAGTRIAAGLPVATVLVEASDTIRRKRCSPSGRRRSKGGCIGLETSKPL